jgi:hypothetical protein
MAHRPHHVDRDLAEQAMRVFKEWLGVRRVAWLQWRARVAQLPHFDLNDSDASDDEAPMGGMHSTSRGVHNLAMTGDMPIAQYSMDELLDLLDHALDNDATAADAARLTVLIAQRTGTRTIRPSALAAVTAACRYLRKPHVYASPAHAATAAGEPTDSPRDPTLRTMAAARAMAPHGAIAGNASALMGTLQFGAGALAGVALGALQDGTALPMALVVAFCGVGGLVVRRLLVR